MATNISGSFPPLNIPVVSLPVSATAPALSTQSTSPLPVTGFQAPAIATELPQLLPTTQPGAPPRSEENIPQPGSAPTSEDQGVDTSGGEIPPEIESQNDPSSEAETVGEAAEENSEERSSTELSEVEIQQVQELRAQDRRVRQHEQTHLAAGGQYITGGPSYSFTTGPDGKQYATSGEVSIDTSKAATPEQTLVKAQIIRRAALAPAEPSGQDRAVAARATQLEAQARREIAEKNAEEARNETIEEGSPQEIRLFPSDLEFTEIGPSDTEEKETAPSTSESRTPIVSIPVPLSPAARADVGQLIDFIG